jgi:hypothetical protein
MFTARRKKNRTHVRKSTDNENENGNKTVIVTHEQLKAKKKAAEKADREARIAKYLEETRAAEARAPAVAAKTPVFTPSFVEVHNGRRLYRSGTITGTNGKKRWYGLNMNGPMEYKKRNNNNLRAYARSHLKEKFNQTPIHTSQVTNSISLYNMTNPDTVRYLMNRFPKLRNKIQVAFPIQSGKVLRFSEYPRNSEIGNALLSTGFGYYYGKNPKFWNEVMIPGKNFGKIRHIRTNFNYPALVAPGGFKKGGKIPKAGLYKLHKGEVVVPAHRVKTVDKALKKSKRKPLKKVCKNCVLTKKQLAARRVSSTRARR